MTTETVQQVNPKMSATDKIKAWMQKHRVTVESTFVPCSQSRNAKGKEKLEKGRQWLPTLNWKVRVGRLSPVTGNGLTFSKLTIAQAPAIARLIKPQLRTWATI